MRRLAIFILAAAMTVLAMAGTASAAHRRVPFGFFGVDGANFATLPEYDSQMALMAESGVESVRTGFTWSQMEPFPGVYNFAASDELVGEAASHGLQLLPVIDYTPQWASSAPQFGDYGDYAPRNPATIQPFMTAVIHRYGPHGTFWAANPRLPRDPIRDWQIWDEPEGTYYDWRSKPWPQTYTRLLKAAYTAVHRADPGAKVVSGAVVSLNATTLTQWAEAEDLYRAGFKHYFDILAVNDYVGAPTVSASINEEIEIVNFVRQVMRRNHDLAKPIWITEVTWSTYPHPTSARIETTRKGQEERLAAYYERVASKPTDDIQRAFWFEWSSGYAAITEDATFNFTGLVESQSGTAFRPLPVLSTYANVAAKFEGCRKTAYARKCR